jgi:large-conductance mechanosensitive channel
MNKKNKLYNNINSDKIKIITILIISIINVLLLFRGPPTKIDDYFEQFLKKKDIYVVLIGTLISNIFTNNISAFTNNIIIPSLSVMLKTDLNKPIKYNNITFNINKVISSLINLLISAFIIIIIFNTKNFT